MNRKRALIIIIILFTGLFPLIPIPIAKATEATVSIQNSEDDVWMTESGNIFGYEASVRILEPEIGIRSFLRFEDVPLLKSSKITLATLNVYAGWDQGETISPGASVTIYGIDEPDCAPFSYAGRVWSLNRPYTSAYVNWNVSDWHYSTWQAVNVTEIVRELVNQYAWEQNNSIGFQILGATDSGYEYRTFEDIDHQHHGAYAYLHFHYDVVEEEEEPPGDPDYGDVEFEEQYGPYMIWRFPGKEKMDYVFSEGTADPYDMMYDYIKNVSTPVSISQTEWVAPSAYGRKIVRLSDGTLYAPYSKQLAGLQQIYVKKSVDDGATWTDETLISIYAGMDGYDQGETAIAVDSNDHLHIVWRGKATGFTTDNQVWYVKYDGSWGTIVRLSTLANMEDNGQNQPRIVVDSNDYIHIAWYGRSATNNQVWHRKYTDSWGAINRVSVGTSMNSYDQTSVSIAVDSNDLVHAVWVGYTDGFPTIRQIWHNVYNATSWGLAGLVLRVSTYAGMETYHQLGPSVAVNSSDKVHVSWQGEANGFTTGRQVWYSDYTPHVWADPVRISTYVGMDGYDQDSSSIAVDSDDYIHVLWHGMATGYIDFNKVWYAGYTDSWVAPMVLQPVGQNKFPNLRWSRWWSNPLETEDIFIVTDENGTIIQTWNGANFTDINDLEDWIDDNLLNGGDPLDPDPGTQGWDIEGPFTRFKMRLYFLVIGLGCIFGPLWAMGYKKLDSVGYAWCALLMILGTGLLWSIVGV